MTNTIAENIDVLQAKAASETPLSKRRKNVKNVSLDVEINLKETGSAHEMERIKMLERRSTEACEEAQNLASERRKAKAQSLVKIGAEKLIFPRIVSIRSSSSTRISHIKEARVGDILELKPFLEKNEVTVLNAKGEVLGLLPCGSFGYIDDEVLREGLPEMEIYERMIGYCEIIAVYHQHLQAKISSLTISSYNAQLDVEIKWK